MIFRNRSFDLLAILEGITDYLHLSYSTVNHQTKLIDSEKFTPVTGFKLYVEEDNDLEVEMNMDISTYDLLSSCVFDFGSHLDWNFIILRSAKKQDVRLWSW